MTETYRASRIRWATEEQLRGLETALIDYALAEVRQLPGRAATLKALLPRAVQECLDKIVALHAARETVEEISIDDEELTKAF